MRITQNGLPDNFIHPGHIANIAISSPSFNHRGHLPREFTRDGKNHNPGFTIGPLPIGTISLVLIMEDTDAPKHPWAHWVVYNIPAVSHIRVHSIPGEEAYNDFKLLHYCGPCPPNGTHRYHFRFYALSDLVCPGDRPSKAEVIDLMTPHILGYGEIIGLYRQTDPEEN